MKLQLDIKKAIKSESKRKAPLSDLQKEYRKFFRKELKASGMTHPFEGSPDDTADFFFELSKKWKKHKKSL